MDGFNRHKLEQLGLQLERLRHQAMQQEPGLSRRKLVQMKEHNRFYPSLFNSKGLSWKPYLDEIDSNFAQLSRLVDENAALAQVSHLCGKILEQYSALSRAVGQPERKAPVRKAVSKYEQMVRKVVVSNQELYETLSQQKEFERRLEDMILAAEQALAGARSQIQRDQLTDKVLQLRQRLGRCRQATWQVEETIRRVEKRN